jgi:hypothetical protein
VAYTFSALLVRRSLAAISSQLNRSLGAAGRGESMEEPRDRRARDFTIVVRDASRATRNGGECVLVARERSADIVRHTSGVDAPPFQSMRRRNTP